MPRGLKGKHKRLKLDAMVIRTNGNEMWMNETAVIRHDKIRRDTRRIQGVCEKLNAQARRQQGLIAYVEAD